MVRTVDGGFSSGRGDELGTFASERDSAMRSGGAGCRKTAPPASQMGPFWAGRRGGYLVVRVAGRLSYRFQFRFSALRCLGCVLCSLIGVGGGIGGSAVQVIAQVIL